MEWSEDYIESIVNNIREQNIVPIIGPNVLRVKKGTVEMPIQEYVVSVMLNKHLPEEANEQNIQTCSKGVKGMSRLNRLFVKHNKKLNGYLYKLYKDEDFVSSIIVDRDVLQFLQLGNFPLILTTTNYCILENLLTFHGRKYDSVSYRKEKVKDNPEQDILLKNDKHDIETPAIFHLFGTISVTPGTSVVTEDEFLMFLHCLQDTNTRPENLKEYLKLENNKYLLTLGCDIPDWTFRFLLYSLKADKNGIRDYNAADNYFVGGVVDAHLSDDITEFLLDIGYYSGNQVSAFLRDINKHLSPIEKPKVFLSLCSEEYDIIGESLYKILSESFDVWFYKYNGDQHRYWNDPEYGIEVGLKASEFILPIITPSAINRIYEYSVPDMPNDDTSGLIEEWIRAKKYNIKCCPLYIGQNEENLKKAIKKSDCADILWPFFFSGGGNAGLTQIDLKTFSAEQLYNHIKNHLHSNKS